MAAIDFPNTPTNGQIFTSGTLSWTYQTGVGWILNSGTGGSLGFTYTQDTVPTTPAPVHGVTWHDTSTGISYVYVVDANSSQWVQFAPGNMNWPYMQQFRQMTYSAQTITTGTTTNLFFVDSNSDFIGDSIGNPVSGAFTVKDKGIYLVSCVFRWSTTFSTTGVQVDLHMAGASIGTQACVSPWGITENSFMLDQTTGGSSTQFGLRVFNTLATMTMSTMALRVSKVSDRK